MTTPSARLAIAKPTPADDFDTAEIAANWQKVDDHPGIYICTTGTRPAWGGAHEGMMIYETDSGLYWTWTGAAFERSFASGYLGGTSRTTPVTEAAGVAIAVLAQAVTIPAGGRAVAITCGWPSCSGDGEYQMYVARGGIIRKWGFFAGSEPGGCITHYDTPSAGAVTYTYYLLKVSGTTCGIGADAISKIYLDVVEV